MTDFFISYTKKDEDWAAWIGYTLEANGFNVIVQIWDMRPGSNFVLEMQRAASTADRTILVLSPDYLKSDFAAPEWTAAFARDPQGLNQRVVPVMVRDCEPEGLLKPIVYIMLVGLNEDAARIELLSGVDKRRAKPSTSPPYPGEMSIKPPKVFPGYKSSAGNKRKGAFAAVSILAAAIAGAAAVLSVTGNFMNFSTRATPPVLPPYDSPEMGGGHDQDEQCEPLRRKYAAENPNFDIVRNSWQDSKKDLFGKVSYWFHCRYSAVPK